jgi:thiaminase/transcriptional activator TenA
MKPAAPQPLFSVLREAARPSWDAYVRHSFVLALRDGTLPEAAFLHYLKQDYLFLIHFARAWALVVTKSSQIDEMRHAIGVVNALVNTEMSLHVAICAARGIDEAMLRDTPEEPENMAYTRFVIDAGLRGDLLDLLVALAPCGLGYGEIGMTLLLETGGAPAAHPYSAWINTYGGEAYQSSCSVAEELLDRVCGRLIGPAPALSPRWPLLVKTFDSACRLEAAFWAMGLKGGDQATQAATAP